MNIKSLIEDVIQHLPYDVVLQILSLLPSEYISEFFLELKSSPIRQIVIEHYYSKELHVILSPTRRPHYCGTHSDQTSELIDFSSYIEIDEFFTDHPDINPSRLVIITGGDFRSFETLLNKFHDRISSKIKQLHFHIERYEPNAKDLELLTSFQNLSKLQLTGADLKILTKTNYLSNLNNLNQIVFLGHKVKNWTNVLLPPNLKQLDVSWNEESDILTLPLPESITEIFWNQAGGITNKIFTSKVFPKNLKTLMLTYNKIIDLNVDSLPKTLETIDLLCNSISTFLSKGEGYWPPNLETILLSHNQIDNHALESLSKFKWPLNLKVLKLDHNKFTNLIHLQNIPNTLEYLDISQTKLNSLNVLSQFDQIVNNESFQYFQFPTSLISLNLGYNDIIFPTSNGVNQRIRFPSHLSSLNLDECNIKSLDTFIFPSSLVKLSLCGNKIEDLNSYNIKFNSTSNGNICWSQLIKLSSLELYLNQISTLENWFPPPNLHMLDLGKNQLNELTLINTPLFQSESKNNNNKTLQLQKLQLELNNILKLDNFLKLPPKLRNLLLKENSLTGELIIPKSFAQLESLDLGFNSIESLRFSKVLNSNLKTLNLTKNLILRNDRTKSSIEEFYENIEVSLGINATKHKASVNSVHTFKR